MRGAMKTSNQKQVLFFSDYKFMMDIFLIMLYPKRSYHIGAVACPFAGCLCVSGPKT